MKIWLAGYGGRPESGGVIDYGALLEAGSPSQGAMIVSNPDDSLDRPADAWVIPAGLGGHSDLIVRAVSGNCPVIVALNGIGPSAFNHLRSCLSPGQVIYMFDARDETPLCFIEQVTWLRSREASFAIMANEQEHLNLATAMGAEALLVPEPSSLDFGNLERITRARAKSALRPFSPNEIDHLDRREAGLTVKTALGIGEIVKAHNLDIAVTDERGLAPYLREKVIGHRLRYEIGPGEPLTFGHLEMDIEND